MAKAKAGKYKGEITLLKNKDGHRSYPVTKNGKVHCGRVRSAKAYAISNDVYTKLVDAGFAEFAEQCGVDIFKQPKPKPYGDTVYGDETQYGGGH